MHRRGVRSVSSKSGSVAGGGLESTERGRSRERGVPAQGVLQDKRLKHQGFVFIPASGKTGLNSITTVLTSIYFGGK